MPRHAPFYGGLACGAGALILGLWLVPEFAISLGSNALFAVFLLLTALKVPHLTADYLREHARERASEQVGAQVLISGAAVLLGAGDAATDLGNVFYKTFFGLPHSRLQETEADRIGVEIAARAGYDPRAAVTLWQKMAQKAGGGGGPEFLSTHPSAENRLKDLQVYAQRVMPLYQQASR